MAQHTAEDLLSIRNSIILKIDKAEQNYKFLMEDALGFNPNGTDETFKPLKINESDGNFAGKRKAAQDQLLFLNDLKAALIRLDDNPSDFGKCKCSACKGNLLPVRRLIATPHATKCTLEKTPKK